MCASKNNFMLSYVNFGMRLCSKKKCFIFFGFGCRERENIVESDNKQSINRWTENDVTINWYSTGYSIVVNTLPIIRSLHYQWVCPKRRANEIKKNSNDTRKSAYMNYLQRISDNRKKNLVAMQFDCKFSRQIITSAGYISFRWIVSRLFFSK